MPPSLRPGKWTKVSGPWIGPGRTSTRSQPMAKRRFKTKDGKVVEFDTGGKRHGRSTGTPGGTAADKDAGAEDSGEAGGTRRGATEITGAEAAGEAIRLGREDGAPEERAPDAIGQESDSGEG